MAQPSVVRVAMAKRVARRWLQENATPEYRITVLEAPNLKQLTGVLKAFRDGKTKIASLERVPDLGVRVVGPQLELRSGNHAGMLALDAWLEKTGFATTGIW